MDFETCFFECCQACNCLDEDFKLPLEIQDQDDCKGSFAVQDEQCIWMNLDQEKTFKTKVGEEDKREFNTENLLKLQNPDCDCLKKPSRKQTFLDKYKFETKQEAKESEIFKNCRNPWRFPYANWSSNRSKRIYPSGDHSNSDRVLVDSVLELKEKVDILFQILKGCGQKFSIENCEKRAQTKTAQPILGDFWHLLDFNKRLCATEEGIKKLALILEDHFKNFNRKKSSSDLNPAYRDPLNFEEMSIGQRINLLKTRNDLLLDLVKNFLKVGSVEEIYSSLSLLPNNAEIKQTPEFHYTEKKTQENNLNADDIIDTLKNLRMQFTKIQENKPQSSVQQPKIMHERRENTLKYFGNKLEIPTERIPFLELTSVLLTPIRDFSSYVISEQAELTLNNENENEKTNKDDYIKKNGRNFTEKCSEDSESLREITSKLLAQEALLKSSLDKVHFEICSKLDSTDKKCIKDNQSIANKTEVPITAENQECDIETDFNSSSSAKDVGYSFYETEITAKSKSNDTVMSSEKCVHHKELKESVKEEENSLESTSDNLCKESSSISGKKMYENKEVKTKYPRKILPKNTFTVLSPSSKSSKNDYCLPVRCSSSRVKPKNEDEMKDKRPVTAPNCHSKSMPSSSLKPPVSQKNIKKNLGLNNVTNKNKTSLSKKTFVETS